MCRVSATVSVRSSLNESPSEKEGKCIRIRTSHRSLRPSMKVPPKRKGNLCPRLSERRAVPLNESPSEKEGKSKHTDPTAEEVQALNESPSEKEGKSTKFTRSKSFLVSPQ